MIAADGPGRGFPRLAALDADGGVWHLPRSALATLFGPGDLVVANDAATLPASLGGTHVEKRRADRGAARGVAFARRPHAVRGHCLRGGRSSHAHRGPAASAAAFARRPPLARPARRHRRAAARPSAPFRPAVRGRSGRRPGRPRAPRAADPVCARPQAARSLGRLDENRRRSGRVRAALGRLCAGLAHTCGLAAPRRRFRHAHPRRRHFLHRRSDARPAVALRRAVSHPGEDRGRDLLGEVGAGPRHRDRDDGGPRTGSRRDGRRRRARRRRRRARAHRRRHAGSRSSTPSSPACTRRAKAISSCCAPSPTTRRSIASPRR